MGLLLLSADSHAEAHHAAVINNRNDACSQQRDILSLRTRILYMRDACLHTYPLPDVGRRYSELRCGWSACLVSRRTPTIHRREKISCRVSEQPLGGTAVKKVHECGSCSFLRVVLPCVFCSE